MQKHSRLYQELQYQNEVHAFMRWHKIVGVGVVIGVVLGVIINLIIR